MANRTQRNRCGRRPNLAARLGATDTDVQNLEQSALGMVHEERYGEARQLLEIMMGLGCAKPRLVLAYARCLLETGDDDRAVRVWATVNAHCERLSEDAPERQVLAPMLDEVRRQLPGGKLHAALLGSLRDDKVGLAPSRR